MKTLAIFLIALAPSLRVSYTSQLPSVSPFLIRLNYWTIVSMEIGTTQKHWRASARVALIVKKIVWRKITSREVASSLMSKFHDAPVSIRRQKFSKIWPQNKWRFASRKQSGIYRLITPLHFWVSTYACPSTMNISSAWETAKKPTLMK